MSKITRRDLLKISGLGAGAIMAGTTLNPGAPAAGGLPGGDSNTGVTFDPEIIKHITESFYIPGEQLASDKMRITIMGSCFIPRIGQSCNSVFIECGSGENFVFDCGAGVCAK